MNSFRMHSVAKGLGYLLLTLLVFTSITVANAGTFAYANFDVYGTRFTFVNPTDEPITVPDFWTPFRVGGPTITIAPRSAEYFSAFPFAGGNVFTMDIPDGLEAYSEIQHQGLFMRIPDLGAPVKSASFYALKSNLANYASYVFIASPEGTSGKITGSHDGVEIGVTEFIVPTGGVVILEVPLGSTAATVTIGGAGYGYPGQQENPAYIFAFVTDRISHNMIPVTRY